MTNIVVCRANPGLRGGAEAHSRLQVSNSSSMGWNIFTYSSHFWKSLSFNAAKIDILVVFRGASLPVAQDTTDWPQERLGTRDLGSAPPVDR